MSKLSVAVPYTPSAQTSPPFGWAGKTIDASDVLEHERNTVKADNPGILMAVYVFARVVPWLNLYYLFHGTVQRNRREDTETKALVFLFGSAVVAVLVWFFEHSLPGAVVVAAYVPFILDALYIVTALTVGFSTGQISAFEQTWHFTPVSGYDDIPSHIAARMNLPFEKDKANFFVRWYGGDPFLVLVENSTWKPMFLRQKVYVGAWETGTWMDKV